MIELTLLGPPTVRVDGGDPPRELLWKKNLALLVYLARSPGGRRSRDHLIGVFWGDREEAKARHSLNEALRTLRSVGGQDFVETAGDQIVLHGAMVSTDARRFQAAEAIGDWAAAVRWIGGAFMEGFSVPGCSDFADWLYSERYQMGGRLVDALVRRAEELVDGGDLAGARELADRAVRLSPLSEVATRLALLVRALSGERAEAINLFDEFAARLMEELELEPDPETIELAERIRNERSWKLPDTVSPTERLARRTELVGRARPLARALDALRTGFESRSSRLVVVQGQPGVGKSRLAEEVLARCRMEGARTAQVRAIPADRTLENETVRGLLRSLAGAGTAEPPDFLDALKTATDDTPLVLLIDDAEFVDPASWAAVQRSLRDLSGAPLAFLLCASWAESDVALDELRAWLGRDVEGCVVTLTPLAQDEVEALAGSLLPDLDLEERARLARRVHTDSAGLPLLSLELLNAVRLGLELGSVQPGWPAPNRTLAHTFPGELPTSVVAAIRVGYRRLGKQAGQLLAAASVLGDRVSAELLGKVCDLSGPSLHASLDELEWQRWLVADERGYTFVARIVRDVVSRDMLTPGQRQRILAAAGRAVG
jgi:DNA-binding SARP family transcriptional activator